MKAQAKELATIKSAMEDAHQAGHVDAFLMKYDEYLVISPRPVHAVMHWHALQERARSQNMFLEPSLQPQDVDHWPTFPSMYQVSELRAEGLTLSMITPTKERAVLYHNFGLNRRPGHQCQQL